MTKKLDIAFKTFFLLLTIHLVATNICTDYYLKLLNQSTKSILSKHFDAEEDNDSSSKSSEPDTFDDLDDDYLASSFLFFDVNPNSSFAEITRKHRFSFSSIVLPQVHYEIQIPPPRA